MKMSLKENKRLKFKINIEGAKERPQIRFWMKGLPEGMSLVLDGRYSSGLAEVNIPPLSILEGMGLTKFKASLEVLIDGQFFENWNDEIEIEEEVKVESTLIEVEDTEKKTPIIVETVLDYDPEGDIF
jgi:hypothetical protein